MAVKKFASGKDDPNRKGVFVIKYVLGDPPSYFKQMTGIGPAYGADLAKTPRFSTAMEASDQIMQFPMMAAVGAEVFEIVPTKKAARKK